MSFLDYDNKAKDEGHTSSKHETSGRGGGRGEGRGIRKGEGSLLLEKNVMEKLF